MRGKIIQYNGTDGRGIIMAEGKQFEFTIAAWRSDSVPAAGKTVEIDVQGDTVAGVSTVSDDILLREKTAELSGKLGSALGGMDLSSLQGGGGGAIVARYGKVLIGAYAVFLIASLMFNAVSVSMLGNSMGKSLFDVAALLSQMGANGGGGIKLVLILAYIGAALPIVWADRRAWLALLLPLLGTLWAIFAVMRILSSMGGGMMGDMSDLVSIDLGFYLSLAAAVVLAFGGLKRFLRPA